MQCQEYIVLLILVTECTALINLQLGITICKKCQPFMKSLEGKYADDILFSELNLNPPSMASAKVNLLLSL